MSYRRLTVLIRYLPKDSATMQQILGREFASWDVTDYLLAAVVDVLQGANWQRGGGKGQRPKPLPRPKSKVEIEEHNRRHVANEARLRELREKRRR